MCATHAAACSVFAAPRGVKRHELIAAGPSFRQQALDWLRAELVEQKRIGEVDPTARLAVQDSLKKWQKDPKLASVREEAALAKLPSPEQAAWRQLWADVADVLRSQKKKVPATTP